MYVYIYKNFSKTPSPAELPAYRSRKKSSRAVARPRSDPDPKKRLSRGGVIDMTSGMHSFVAEAPKP